MILWFITPRVEESKVIADATHDAETTGRPQQIHYHSAVERCNSKCYAIYPSKDGQEAIETI